MCCRYTCTLSGDELERLFGLLNFYDYSPRYNLAPSQTATAVRRSAAGTPEAVRLTWGFLDRAGATPWPNARWETAATKPTFRESIRNRRCLIPADGFFEWWAVAKKKWPIWFRLADGVPFAFAGIWHPAVGPGNDTFGILTTESNDLVRPVHDRMPVILTPSDFDTWLAAGYDPGVIARLCRPFPADRMSATPVDPAMNNWRNERPELLRFTPPPPETGDLFTAI